MCNLLTASNILILNSERKVQYENTEDLDCIIAISHSRVNCQSDFNWNFRMENNPHIRKWK